MMPIRSEEELWSYLLDGWAITRKGKYYYVQKKEGGKVRNVKIDDKLKKLAEELHYIYKFERDKYQDMLAEKATTIKPKTTSSQGSQSSRGPNTSSQDDKIAKAVADNLERKVTKAVEQKLTYRVVKHLDLQTKYIMKWGEWVLNHVVTIVPGDTFEEKAQEVDKFLDEMFRFYLQSDDMKRELDQLRIENTLLKEALENLRKRLDAISQLKELIIQLADKNPDLAKQLIEQFIALITNLEASYKVNAV